VYMPSLCTWWVSLPVYMPSLCTLGTPYLHTLYLPYLSRAWHTSSCRVTRLKKVNNYGKFSLIPGFSEKV